VNGGSTNLKGGKKENWESKKRRATRNSIKKGKTARSASRSVGISFAEVRRTDNSWMRTMKRDPGTERN